MMVFPYTIPLHFYVSLSDGLGFRLPEQGQQCIHFPVIGYFRHI